MKGSVSDRFWVKVTKGDGCWNWIGAHLPNGYGVMNVNGKNTMAHRVSYSLHIGPIPDNQNLYQVCKNRQCVRPDHLALQPTGDDRFWLKVDKTNTCWIWTGARDPNGYGRYGLGTREDGIILAHRQSWSLLKGPIPEGKDLCHTCDNPSCVNPDHLFPGTHDENMQDMSRKGRAARGEEKPNTILTEALVLEIRSIIAQRPVVNGRPPKGSPYSFVKIAEMFGVSEATIRDIDKRRIWKHI